MSAGVGEVETPHSVTIPVHKSWDQVLSWKETFWLYKGINASYRVSVLEKIRNKHE